MIRLNLLPYRARQQAAHRHRFNLLSLGMLLSCVLVISSMTLVLEQRINWQEEHNQHQDNVINALSKHLRSVDTVRKTTTALLAQEHWLKRLERTQEHAAQLLEQLSTIPEGVALHELKPSPNGYTLSGQARSLQHIALFLHELSNSRVFVRPRLVEFKRTLAAGDHNSEFIIDVETVLG